MEQSWLNLLSNVPYSPPGPHFPGVRSAPLILGEGGEGEGLSPQTGSQASLLALEAAAPRRG